MVLCLPVAKAIFNLVPTPSADATKTGSRIFGKAPSNIPPKLPISERVRALKVVRASSLIFSVARLIEFISAYVQLLPGDLVLTGSPSGNGTHYNRYIQDGDLLEGEISGLGALRNPCIAESRPE